MQNAVTTSERRIMRKATSTLLLKGIAMQIDDVCNFQRIIKDAKHLTD